MDYNFIIIVVLVLLILYLYENTFLKKPYRENFQNSSSSPPVDLEEKIVSIVVNNYNSIPAINSLKNIVLNELQKSGINIEQNKDKIYAVFDTKFRERLQVDVLVKLNEQKIINENNKDKINEYIKMVFDTNYYKDSKNNDVIPSAIELVSLIKDLLDYSNTEDSSNLQYRLLEEQAQQNTYNETTKNPNTEPKLQNTMVNLHTIMRDQFGDITPEMEQHIDTILSGSNLPNYLSNDDVKQILEQITLHQSGQSNYPDDDLSIDLSSLKQTIIDSMKDKYKIYKKTDKDPSFYDIMKMLYDLDLFKEFEANFKTIEEKQILYKLLIGDRMGSDISNGDHKWNTNFNKYLLNKTNWKKFSKDYPNQKLDSLDSLEFEKIRNYKKKNTPLRGLDNSMLNLSNNENVNYSDEEERYICSLDKPCNKNPKIISDNLNLNTMFNNNQVNPKLNMEVKDNNTNMDKMIKTQENILMSLNKIVKNINADKNYTIDF